MKTAIAKRSFRVMVLVGLLVLLPCAWSQEKPPTTLAVLNFSNRNPDDGWDWLEKGLADMLITDLSKSAQLQVVERERMQSFFDEMRLSEKGLIQQTDAAGFGKVTKAQQVLFGSYLKRGTGIEVEAHVMNVQTGQLARVEWVRGDAAEILSLEKQLAMKVVENLSVKLTQAEMESLQRLPTVSVDAATVFYRGLDLYDKGSYEDALAQFRSAARQDSTYYQARHWSANIFHAVGEYEHAVWEYRRNMEAAADDHWGGESAFCLGQVYEMNLADADRAIESYRTLTERFAASKRVADAWRRMGDLYERKEDWVQAFKAISHTGASDRSTQVYLYGKVLETSGEAIEPPEYVTTLDVNNPQVFQPAPFPRKTDYIEEYSFIKAPPGYELKSADFEIRGQLLPLQAGDPKDTTRRVELIAWQFPPGNTRGYQVLDVKGEEPSTEKGSVTFPPRTTIITVWASVVCAKAEYWKASFTLQPLEAGDAAKLAKPQQFKLKIVQMEDPLVVVPVPRGGAFNPCVVEDRSGRLWAVYNDVGEFGEFPWKRTGSQSALWLMSSRDGMDWTSPDYLPINASGPEYKPSLMVDRDGRLWLTWVSGRGFDGRPRIWISSTLDGKRWAPPRMIPLGQNFDIAGMPALVQGSDGVFRLAYAVADIPSVVYKAYKENPSSPIPANGLRKVFLSSSKDTVEWTPPVEIPVGQSVVRDISAVQSSDGVTHVILTLNSNGFDSLSSPDGVHWDRSEYGKFPKGKVPNMLYRPRLIQCSDGSFLVVCQDPTKGTVGFRSSDCKSWQELGYVSPRLGRSAGESPCIVERRSGGFCLVSGGKQPIQKDICVELIKTLPIRQWFTKPTWSDWRKD